MSKSSYFIVGTLALSLAACGDELIERDAELLSTGQTARGAGTRLHVVTPGSFSGWSGRSGGTRVVLSRPPSDDLYFWGANLNERYDDPCHMWTFFSAITESDRHISKDRTFEECGTWGPHAGGNTMRVRMGPDFKTTGLAVCLNSDETKMKGFALVGRYQRCIRDQSLTARGHSCLNGGPLHIDAEERNNCPGSKNGPDGDWEAIVECPLGSVMTGIELNTRAGGGSRRMVNGARAICHRLDKY
ncbi:MAG: hypothetical protein AAFU79_24115 [Myxococcota bacterium]